MKRPRNVGLSNICYTVNVELTDRVEVFVILPVRALNLATKIADGIMNSKKTAIWLRTGAPLNSKRRKA